MSTEKTDIAQISKYLSGELDAKAMHELERRALDDPFLMDALEGYGSSGADQQANLSELNTRLHQRFKSARKRIILWPVIAVAASIVLFLVVGGLWFFNQKKASLQAGRIASTSIAKTEIAKSNKNLITPFIKKGRLSQDLTILKPNNRRIKIAGQVATGSKKINKQTRETLDTSHESLADNQMSAKSTRDSTSKPNMLAEVVVTGYPTQRKREVAGSVATLSAKPVQQGLEGKVSGVNIASKYNIDSAGRSLITGQILSKTDGGPLPGVVVSVIGKEDKVLTDAQGRFNIRAGRQDELSISYIGFLSERVKVKANKDLKVMLSENQNTLSEVVVVPREGQNIEKAHPISGWVTFSSYLKENASLPDGITGTVQLSFVVNPDNSLSNFTITKSLSSKADEKAIQLIKNGSSWVHNQNGKRETIKLKVRF